MFKFKHTPEDRPNSARIREHIGQLLRDHYQACMTHKLPPRLREVLKKLDEEKHELSGEHVQVIDEKNH
jgi:hypothetical protein